MKVNVFTALAFFGSSALAIAADPAVETPMYSVYDWSGAYAGVHLGYGWGDSDFTDLEGWNLFGQTFAIESDGFLGGVQSGYNWQSGSFVFGGEAELGYLDLGGRGLQQDGVFNDTYGLVDGGWYAGLSARLGFAMDRTLFYAKAGGVYLDGKYLLEDGVTLAGPDTLVGSETIGWGYQIGAGVEHAVTENWTLKLEYAYFDFGSETVTGFDSGGAPWDYRADLSAHTVKIGVNYKF